jgi:hypothetical protein
MARGKSEYKRLVAMGLIQERKGQAVMTDEERRERRRRQTRLMMEARRRAERLVVNNHKAEFDRHYRAEKAALQADPDYAVPERA